VPPCYRDALALLGRPETEFEVTRRREWTYHLFDCLSAWPAQPPGRGFDLITAIGCFGLAPDPTSYTAAVAAAGANLAAPGRLIGADWVRSRLFIEMEGHDNRYLSPHLTTAGAREAGLSVLEMREVPIEGDRYYDSVLVWALGRDA